MSEMYIYENTFYANGKKYIAGVDEVGRGSMIGPVITAAVILNPDMQIEGLNDSKKLSPKKRRELEQQIKAKALAWSIGEASIVEVDQLNVYQATKLAMKRAIDALNVQADAILIDAMPLEVNVESLSIIKGDSKSASIAAASIIAKEHRDRLIVEESMKYPEYQFDKNKGYLTKAHKEALLKFGPTEYHRTTFEPVKGMLKTLR